MNPSPHRETAPTSEVALQLICRYMHVRLFDRYWSAGYLTRDSHALSIGASTGEEVRALYQAGVRHAIGVDLVERPPLVVKGKTVTTALPIRSGIFEDAKCTYL